MIKVNKINIFLPLNSSFFLNKHLTSKLLFVKLSDTAKLYEEFIQWYT